MKKLIATALAIVATSASAQQDPWFCADKVAPVVTNDPLTVKKDPEHLFTYAKACSVCVTAVIRKYHDLPKDPGDVWTTPGKFADMSQVPHDALGEHWIWFVSGRRFVNKELQVMCTYHPDTATVDVDEDRSPVGTYGEGDK